jgi:PncC family amidohydrolase
MGEFMSVAAAAARVARELRRTNLKVVFAESCTGGLVSGALTRIPGISEFHCGGVVVYRNATKQAYLDVPTRLLKKPGPVSAKMTQLLARRVLHKTPEADVALAVTGHLGPNAPRELDGQVFVALAWRQPIGKRPAAPGVLQLDGRSLRSRLVRQRWAVVQALVFLAEKLEARR